MASENQTNTSSTTITNTESNDVFNISYKTSREMRNRCLINPIPFKGPGVIRTEKHELFIRKSDGFWSISPKAYPDDILSFTLSMMISNPNMNPEIARGVAQTIDLMDKRALERHGYSHNLDEQQYQWISVENQLNEIINKRK